MAPTETLEEPSTPSCTVQVLGPAAVTVVARQFHDQPPKATPGSAGAVRVTMVPRGYVAVQMEPAEPEPGPQSMTLGVPVAEGAVMSQSVVFNPALKTVRGTNRPRSEE